MPTLTAVRHFLLIPVFMAAIAAPHAQAEFQFDPGEPDNGRHPGVGWMAAFNDAGHRLPAYCSGSLIAPRVFLTAGHCTKAIYDDVIADPAGDNIHVFVGFSDDFIASGEHIDNVSDKNLVFSAAQVITNPNYDGNWQSKQPDGLDLGVVILKQAPPLPLSRLPYLNELDDLKKAKTLRNADLTIVGFGATDVIIPPDSYGSPWNFFQSGQLRYLASPSYRALHPAYLTLSINFATGDSGSCWGDSGGPIYLGAENKIVAITASGDMMCRASASSVRTDTQAAREFLRQFQHLGLDLP